MYLKADETNVTYIARNLIKPNMNHGNFTLDYK